MRLGQALAWLATDIVAVSVFCAVGRCSHAEGLTVADLAVTLWPFLTGTAIGWLASRGWQRPTAVVPTGVVVWLCTVVVGVALRKASSAGVVANFMVVAASTTAALFLGWRAVVELILRRRSTR
ncbi:hypothetical protein JK2ML_0271 [Mycobacterium leprae Kyoto-2]|uniref:Membrane protein n=4 Tax=Mycobacterium leprae TaxID=1769 RepID=Q9CCX5_MYCLE|nr:DUF3054 family protein [Mycobacterium leprae]CAR70364.1 putative membrane protein [Mycobacterium leprae Br4923]AWV47240.1 DUF3054 domain-containing protein [Mycobacterium leprae]OAR20120.1 hypothetical protein A8144_12115 [Mycobacterium leprae 3125609]OAX70528.1 hypothetical protein A3216_11355 [Mycobacterium leprae 7935681]CAC29779.1 putative membrane protein [Mycobacterium leprae]